MGKIHIVNDGYDGFTKLCDKRIPSFPSDYMTLGAYRELVEKTRGLYATEAFNICAKCAARANKEGK